MVDRVIFIKKINLAFIKCERHSCLETQSLTSIYYFFIHFTVRGDSDTKTQAVAGSESERGKFSKKKRR